VSNKLILNVAAGSFVRVSEEYDDAL